ncbi:HD-domain/PDEase-like protein [Wolfiporia cocos MD-104 SS10]|uniref:Phosphodiesterase n=1 Tax=Wolfiporia cocos (strain MD-104) TaxID=742152 RepID=A0A2H3JS13_WOLCO|nr:HD-domain/PDEase-like protein [Wolfiporia cocos MD-104 SS10]
MNEMAAFGRRRSVDVGGLALALSEAGSGHGWGGWEETENGETRYAEVLIDVRAHTESILNSEPAHFADIALADATRHRLVRSLCAWNFEPHKLPEEEVLACSYILFEALFRIDGLQHAVGIPLNRIASFLQHLRQVYRQGNSYHNFQHALDVFQATYHFLFRAGVVPPVSILLQADNRTWRRDKDHRSSNLMSCLTPEDLLVLSIAAIGHDVGHPGLTNAFMKNARTPLAVVYDDKSVLEQMHYSLILQIMRHNGLGELLDRPQHGPAFRKLLLGTVLATDLSLHAEFMANFTELAGPQGHTVGEHKRKVLVCQALIKCADISNPCRPYSVSKHWVAALESEWSCQLMLERHLHLPATVKPSNDSLGEARGQVWFISTFTLPLFLLVARGIPELEEFAQQCRENLSMWEQRCSELSSQDEPSVSDDSEPTPVSREYSLVANFRTAFPPTLPESFRSSDTSTSRTCSPTPSSIPSCSSSSASSHYESCESGPPSPFMAFTFRDAAPPPPTSPLPRLAISPRTPSIASASASLSASTVPSTAAQHDATAAIRAAYKASVRKKKSWHRSSWNSGSISPPALHPSSASSPATTHHSSPLTPDSARPAVGVSVGVGVSPLSAVCGTQP